MAAITIKTMMTIIILKPSNISNGAATTIINSTTVTTTTVGIKWDGKRLTSNTGKISTKTTAATNGLVTREPIRVKQKNPTKT